MRPIIQNLLCRFPSCLDPRPKIQVISAVIGDSMAPKQLRATNPQPTSFIANCWITKVIPPLSHPPPQKKTDTPEAWTRNLRTHKWKRKTASSKPSFSENLFSSMGMHCLFRHLFLRINVCYIYLLIFHTNQQNIGTVNIPLSHGSYGS